MECKKCNSNIEAQDALNCIACKVKYHYKCVGMSELNYKKLNKAAKSMWRCLGCKTGKSRLSSSSGKEDKKEIDTDLFNKQRMSLLNDLEDNSDDVDGDLEMKESNKSDTLTEEDTQETTPKVKVAGNESTASVSSASATERRSNRIMTRRQRDSEVREQFAKKLNPQQRPKQVLPNSARRFSKSDLNTSDSEAYSSPVLPKKTQAGGMSAKKPPLPLGNKRKSSLEYAKNKKLMRKDDEGVGDTTTTDDDNDDDDTEEDESEDEQDIKPIKTKTNITKNKSNTNNNVKRKLGNQTTVSNVKRKKKDEETSDEDEDDSEEEDESDSDTETDLEEELKKAISKKFPLFKNSPTDSRMKKPLNNHASARGSALKNSGVGGGGGGQKKQISRPTVSSSVNKSTPKNNSKQVTITATRVITKNMDRQFKNETISNIGNTKLYAGTGGGSGKNIESMKIYYPNIEKRNSSSGSPSSQQKLNASRNSGNMSSQRNSGNMLSPQRNKMVPASKRANYSTPNSSRANNSTPNSLASNSSASKIVGKSAESLEHHQEQMSASPKAKSEFDKLVDELFETEITREKLVDKEPELMLIDNEPTDVYTLNIDDTLEEDSDLEALMEEVYEDEAVDPSMAMDYQGNMALGGAQMGNLILGGGNTSLGGPNSTLGGSYLSENRTNTLNRSVNSVNTAASLGHTSNLNINTPQSSRNPRQILNINSPMISPKNSTAVNNASVSKTRTPQQEIALKKEAAINSAASRNLPSNGVNKSDSRGVNTPKQISRVGSQVSVTPVTKTPTVPATKSTQKMTGGGGGEKRTPSQNIGESEKYRGSSAMGIDYKERYNKLLTSYEMLSAKIAQYMEKTKQEKDQLKRQLKRQLKLERSKLEKAQEDIEILKKKFEYLMKNKPSTTTGSLKRKV